MSEATRIYTPVKDVEDRRGFTKSIQVIVREPVDNKVEGRKVELKLTKKRVREQSDIIPLTIEDITKLIEALSETMASVPLTLGRSS